MKIACVGGGPAGLYLAIMTKLRRPHDTVTVHERGERGSTHGWAVVFSADFLDDLYAADLRSGRQLASVATTCADERVRVAGGRPVYLGGLYSYSIDRARMLAILDARATELGVDVRYGDTVGDAETLDADLVVAADGAGSALRSVRAAAFGTTVTAGRNRYAWLGTDRVLPGFVFAFEPTPAGWVWCHAYPSSGSTSTFIVECRPTTWSGLGLDRMAPEEGLRLLEGVFARHLDGHGLRLPRDGGDRSPWLQFRTITNSRWYDGNVVLVGDAAHTTHFSLASGTVLAVRDAIALADALAAQPDVPAALAAYDRRRRAELAPAQRASAVSMRWFENVGDPRDEDAVHFAYALFNRQGDQSPWRYPLHRLTQVPVLRRGRYTMTTARRAARTMRREHRAASPLPTRG